MLRFKYKSKKKIEELSRFGWSKFSNGRFLKISDEMLVCIYLGDHRLYQARWCRDHWEYRGAGFVNGKFKIFELYQAIL